MRARFALVGVALSLAPSAVHAQAMPPDLRLDADEVEADVGLRSFVLRGNVVVLYDRFRLTSPELRLQRTARGVDVEGPGQVVFCPCPDPPLAIGFSGATVAPPADLLLASPKLKLWGTTVFALPWFWLRAPTRTGVLPPILAWRGGDGLLVGDGVHVPWRQGGEQADLDLTAAAYVRGGVEMTGTLRTPHSTDRVRWDRIRGDLLAVDARGAVDQPDDGAVAWDVDAIRGARARSGTIALDEAARAYDRGSGEVVVRFGPAVLGAGVRALAVRGVASPVWGPSASLGAGGPIDAFGAWDGASSLTVLSDPEAGTTEIARLGAGAEASARPGPFVARVLLREATTAAESANDGGVDAAVTGGIEMGLPLSRAYGDESTPALHRIEPEIAAGALAARTVGAYWSRTGPLVPLAQGSLAFASAGLRNVWGRILGRSGASIEGSLGGVRGLSGDAERGSRPLARWRAAWSSRLIAAATEGAAIGGPPAAGQVTIAHGRFGSADGLHANADVAGRTGASPLLARALAPARAEEPSGGWLATEGWSAGAEIVAPFAGVELGAGIDEDVTAAVLLAARARASYTHPCRCLRLGAFAAERLGRDGVDVWVSVDLAPR